MGKRKNTKQTAYLFAVIIVLILSALGFDFESNNDKAVVNVVNLENLQNVTIKTGKEITDEFISTEKQNLKVYFFDVGQADSILIMNEEQTMLIDAGNNEDGELLVSNLQELQVNKIDYLIGTHPHEDHIGGMDNIIENFDIGTIYMPKVQTNTKTFEDVLDAASEKNLKISTPKVNDTFSVGDAKCTVIAIGDNEGDLNSTSIVIQMDFDELSYLFMGDAEKEVEEELVSRRGI